MEVVPELGLRQRLSTSVLSLRYAASPPRSAETEAVGGAAAARVNQWGRWEISHRSLWWHTTSRSTRRALHRAGEDGEPKGWSLLRSFPATVVGEAEGKE